MNVEIRKSGNGTQKVKVREAIGEIKKIMKKQDDSIVISYLNSIDMSKFSSYKEWRDFEDSNLRLCNILDLMLDESDKPENFDFLITETEEDRVLREGFNE